MKAFLTTALLTGMFAATAALAAAPAGAPAGTTGICKDGTYSNSADKKGACRGHKGVQDWYAEPAAKAPAADKKADTAAAPAAPATPAKPAAGAAAAPAAAAPAKPAANAPAATAAAGGGAGKVWANENTKVYHCSGDKWYGKTKKGEYMTEADAKSKGFKADHGHACNG